MERTAWSLSFDLLVIALQRLLVRAPSEKLCTMPEAASGYVIEADFDNKFRRERLPF